MHIDVEGTCTVNVIATTAVDVDTHVSESTESTSNIHSSCRNWISATDQIPTNLHTHCSPYPFQIDPSVTWEFMAWLRTVTKLPIIVKVRRRSTTSGGARA